MRCFWVLRGFQQPAHPCWPTEGFPEVRYPQAADQAAVCCFQFFNIPFAFQVGFWEIAAAFPGLLCCSPAPASHWRCSACPSLRGFAMFAGVLTGGRGLHSRVAQEIISEALCLNF